MTKYQREVADLAAAVLPAVIATGNESHDPASLLDSAKQAVVLANYILVEASKYKDPWREQCRANRNAMREKGTKK